jgi:hypothetical protein
VPCEPVENDRLIVVIHRRSVVTRTLISDQ